MDEHGLELPVECWRYSLIVVAPMYLSSPWSEHVGCVHGPSLGRARSVGLQTYQIDC